MLAQRNVIDGARLRRLAGVGSWAAGIAPPIRPFVAVLWAALRLFTAFAPLTLHEKMTEVWRPGGSQRASIV